MKNNSLINNYICQLFDHSNIFICIFIFAIYLYNVQNSEQIYRTIFSQEFNIILVFSDNYIYIFNSKTLNKESFYPLSNDQKINSLSEGETISFAEYNDQNNLFSSNIYIIIKKYFYAFSKDGMNRSSENINSMEILPNNLILEKCVNEGMNSNCYFFTSFISSSKALIIIKLIYDTSFMSFSEGKKITYNIFNSLGESSQSQSDYVTCQIMKISSNEKYLTCFYENDDNEIGSINFDLSELNEISSKPAKYKKNNGAKKIKSLLYDNNSKAFICYVNNNNDGACLSFDLINNEWSDCEYKYLNNCNYPQFFYFDYFKSSNEYILNCFSSETEMNLVLFNSNMELQNLNNNVYCISESEITFCQTNSFSSSINYNNGYKIDICCSNSNNIKLEETQLAFPCTISSELKCTNSEPHYINTTYPITTLTTSINYNENTYYFNPPIKSTIINNFFPSTSISTNINYLPTTIIETSLSTNIKDLSTIIIETSLSTNIKDLPTIIIESKNSNKIIKKTIDSKKEDFVKNLSQYMEDVDIGQVYEIKADDYEVKISPINFNEYKDSSTYINFLECEKTLRTKNKIPPDSILTVVQIEIYNYEEKSLNNQVEYAVFNEDKQKLDLSVCENDKIEIHYAITNISNIDLEKLSYFSNMDVDILNIKDDFFNDICYPYSENNSDMILEDRVSDIYQNFSLCDDNCEYSNTNISSMTIICSCDVKPIIETEKPDLKFEKIYLDFFSEISLGVLKCFDLVFNLKNKSKNFGFIIFTLLIFLHIPIIIIHSIIGVLPIYKYIISEMEKYHYLPKLNSPIKKDKKNKNDIYKEKEKEKDNLNIINYIEKRKNKNTKYRNKRIDIAHAKNTYI